MCIYILYIIGVLFIPLQHHVKTWGGDLMTKAQRLNESEDAPRYSSSRYVIHVS